MPSFYMSFADGTRLKGDQFLGAVIVPALSLVEAIAVAHVLGINPGGEVLGHRVHNPETGDDIAVPERFQNKLLGREELEELSSWAVGE